jgi:hypothetical protein
MVPISPNPVAAEFASLADKTPRVIGTLRCDFADGRIGERHNRHQHPVRVIRQPAERHSMRRVLSGSGVRA